MKFPTLGACAMLAAAMIGGAPLVAAGGAHAATIVQTFVFPQIFIYPVTATSGNAGFPGFDDEYADQSFNGFNPALGTLESAEISIPMDALFTTNDVVIALYQVVLYYGGPIYFNPIPITLPPWLVFGPNDQGTNLGETFVSPTDLAYFIDSQTLLPDLLIEDDGDAGFDMPGLPLLGIISGPAPGTVTYTYSPAPEPATWAMMLLGMFGAGALLRRRACGKALAG
jgi:hypothetical protein